MNLLALILYVVVSVVSIHVFSTLVCSFCARHGVEAGEPAAKLWAAMMRASEVVVASILLYVLWHYVVHVGGPPTTIAYAVAVLGALYVGGVYVIGSLFAS